MTFTSTANNSRLSTPLWRWSMALLLVCGFGLLAGIPQSIPQGDSSNQLHFDADTSIPLLAHNDGPTKLKRPTSHETQTTGDESNQAWYVAVINQAHHTLAQRVDRTYHAPEANHLARAATQQPITPRAPPFV
jgi:hypothetical protein